MEKDREYGQSLLKQIMASPTDQTTGKFTIEDFNKLCRKYRNRTKREAAEYRRLMMPSRWQRLKGWLFGHYVLIDWTPRKPSLFRRILLFFTVKRKK